MAAALAVWVGSQGLGFSGGNHGPQILRRAQPSTLDADFSKSLPRPARAEPLKIRILKSLENRNSSAGTPRCGCGACSIWRAVLQVPPPPRRGAQTCLRGAGRGELVLVRVFPVSEPEQGTAPHPAPWSYGRPGPSWFAELAGAGRGAPEICVSMPLPLLGHHVHVAPASHSFFLADGHLRELAPDAF